MCEIFGPEMQVDVRSNRGLTVVVKVVMIRNQTRRCGMRKDRGRRFRGQRVRLKPLDTGVFDWERRGRKDEEEEWRMKKSENQSAREMGDNAPSHGDIALLSHLIVL